MNVTQGLNAAKTLLQELTKSIAKQVSDGPEGKKDVSTAKLDERQTIAYDLAWLSSEVYAAEQVMAYAEKTNGELEKALAEFFTAEVISHFSEKLSYRLQDCGLSHDLLMKGIWNPEIAKAVEEILQESSYTVSLRPLPAGVRARVEPSRARPPPGRVEIAKPIARRSAS